MAQQAECQSGLLLMVCNALISLPVAELCSACCHLLHVPRDSAEYLLLISSTRDQTPERWLAGPGGRSCPTKGALRPFETGIRNFLGRHLLDYQGIFTHGCTQL
jgi:hypothetical protein